VLGLVSEAIQRCFNYRASKGVIANCEQARIYKEAVLAYLKRLSLNLPGRTEENHETIQGNE